MSIIRRSGLLLLTLAAFGCQGELQQNPGNVEVKVALEADRMEILETAEVGDLPNPPVDGESIRFVFTPADGAVSVEGAVTDPRVLRSEFDLDGQLDPQRLISDVGLVQVRVPNTAGRLEFETKTGESLGAVELDPDAPVTRTQALMDESDILGRPIKIVDHGDSASKADILFLPEGYAEHELDQFHAHVDEIVAQMSMQSGYRE